MVFLGIELLAVFLVVSISLLVIGFWKKGGLIILIGGIVLMALALFVDGRSYEVLASSQFNATSGVTTNTYAQSIEDYPPIIRIMVVVVGILFMLVGIARYGPTV